jgi:hypothetical protein
VASMADRTTSTSGRDGPLALHGQRGGAEQRTTASAASGVARGWPRCRSRGVSVVPSPGGDASEAPRFAGGRSDEGETLSSDREIDFEKG